MVRQWQELNHEGCYSHSYTAVLPDFVALHLAAKPIEQIRIAASGRRDLPVATLETGPASSKAIGKL